MSDSGGNATSGGARTRLALRVSLALNLFLLLGVIGYGIMHRSPDRFRGGAVMREFVRSLPAELQDEAKQYRRARGGAYRERRATLDAARTGMLAALRAEPFDREAFAAAQRAEAEILSQARATGDSGLADFAAKLSQPQRAAMAAALAERFDERRRRWEERSARRGDD